MDCFSDRGILMFGSVYEDILRGIKAVLYGDNILNYGSDVIYEVTHSVNLSLSDDFGKHLTLQQELSAEEAFWLHMSNPTSKPSDASPVKIEDPKELPKVSLVNESLKKLKFKIVRLDNVVKIRTTPNAHTEDIFYVFDRALLNGNNGSQTVFDQWYDVFKEQFDSIKKTRIRTKEQSNSLIDKLNLKSAENEDLKAQIQDKEQADILWGIVEQAKAKQHLDKELDFACSSKKAKSIESKNANHSEPNHPWGSNATDIPSSSSLVMTGCPDCSLVSGLWMFKTYDREPLSAHELSGEWTRDFIQMTPATFQVRIVSNPVSQQPCIPPTIDDWDHLFQPMFDEYFNPPTNDVSSVQEAAAPRAVVLADSYVLTFIDQDAPSASIPSTQEQEYSPNIS
ncbi:hypothetical protein Tco_0783979 [Tanacetum coccineum]